MYEAALGLYPASSQKIRPVGAIFVEQRIFAELAIILMACQGWANERSAFWYL